MGISKKSLESMTKAQNQELVEHDDGQRYPEQQSNCLSHLGFHLGNLERDKHAPSLYNPR
jgi:hypothetical protein